MRCFRWTALCIVAHLTMLEPPSLQAAVKNWIDGTDNWSVGANWSGGTAPALNDTVNIALTDGVARTITYDVTAPTLTVLTVDLTGGAGLNRTTFDTAGNNLNLINGLIVGDVGRATFNHAAGTVAYTNTSFDSVVGFHAGGNGIYNLSGTGALSVARGLYVGTFSGSTGQFNQTGGTNAVQSLVIGANAGATGTYTISGGTVTSTADVFAGNLGAGTLTIQGQGTVRVGNNLTIGSLGAVNLNGGTLRFNTATGLNRLTYTAGTIQLAGVRNFNFDPAIIAIFGSGPTIPSGKTLVTEGTAQINFFGTTVNGGALTSLSSIEIADSGRLTITGGGTVTNLAGGFLGGVSASSLGEVVVSGAGSTWNNMENLRVGVPGSLNPGRTFLTVNDGATVLVAQTLSIVDQSNVNLQGGTIRFDGYSRTATSHFNFTRGTVQLAGNRIFGTDLAIADISGASPAIPAGKALTIEGAANVQTPVIINGGALKASSLAISGNGALLFDRGTLEITGGAITGLPSLVVPANGEFRASGVQTLRIAGQAGSTITATGNLTLGNAAAANGFYSNGTVAVDGNTLTLNDSNDVVFDSAALATLGAGGSPGTLAAANGLTLDFGGNVTGFGTVDTPNISTKPLINNGHIIGDSVAEPITLSGYVKGVGTFDNVNFTGTFSPGLSPTILSVGNVALSPTSTLIMEIGGTSPGSGYDQIQASGELAFDGALQVSLINGFPAAAGQSFNLFDWASVNGTFDAIQLPTLAGALAWNTSQLYTTGMLSVVAAGVPGDYNNNGTVDAADYVVWRKNQGTTNVLPNDPNGGTIGAVQFNTWRAHFSQFAGSGLGGTANVAVPEPATL